jgi:chitin synthase
MPFPQTNSMFMGMGMGLPQVPRGSAMTNLNMFGPVGGGGSVSGHGSTFGMLPARMSTFTNLNPFAGETDPNPNPTDEEIAIVLRGYLSSQDLMSVTKK